MKRITAVKVYYGYDLAGKRAVRCDLKYSNGEILRNQAWTVARLSFIDDETTLHDMRAVNRFE